MPKPTKKSLLFVAVVLIAFGIFWYLENANAPATVEQNTAYDDVNGDAADTQDRTEQPEVGDPEITTSPTDASDSAIDDDLSVIDSQMQKLDADAAYIDEGLDDQPIEQES